MWLRREQSSWVNLHRMSKRLFQNMPKCPLICLATVRRTFHHTARSLFTQNGFLIWSLFTTHGDCLSLNIWTKTPKAKAKAKKPVLIWFHGGRFTIPDSYSPFYNSHHLSNTEDVVVVMPNYRSGIFGFWCPGYRAKRRATQPLLRRGVGARQHRRYQR